MVTIRDISKACGVSPATVSKALNGYSDVSKETIERVRQAADELHYMPNAAARQLKTNTSHNIGVVYRDNTGSGLAHEYFSAVLDSAKDEAEENGYDITFISDVIGYGSYLEHCRYRRCDGVIIVSEDFESEEILSLIRSEVPIVVIDYVTNDCSSVLSDNIDGGYSLAKYFIEKGHKKIAYVHGELTSVARKRLKGFYRAMEEAGVEVREEYLIEARFHDPKQSAEATYKLMELPDPPTAILYPDDFSYIGGMNALEKMGLSIPEDVSVAGYDGVMLSQVLRPRLTTYKQSAEEIGRASAKKLIETIEAPKTSVVEQIFITGEILEGKSVKDLH